MSATKKSRASRRKRRSVHKTGLVALAAAAMASPVPSAPVLAQSQAQVEQDVLDRQMGTELPDTTTLVPSRPLGAPKEIFTHGVEDKTETVPIRPGMTTGAAPKFSPTARDQLQTGVLQPTPAAQSTKEKALIFTGPSKPSR